jgi:hypothetical protein
VYIDVATNVKKENIAPSIFPNTAAGAVSDTLREAGSHFNQWVANTHWCPVHVLSRPSGMSQ